MPRQIKLRFYRDDDGGHRWRLTAGNGKVIDASSEGFSSKSMARKNFRLVKEAVVTAVEVPSA